MQFSFENLVQAFSNLKFLTLTIFLFIGSIFATCHSNPGWAFKKKVKKVSFRWLSVTSQLGINSRESQMSGMRIRRVPGKYRENPREPTWRMLNVRMITARILGFWDGQEKSSIRII